MANKIKILQALKICEQHERQVSLLFFLCLNTKKSKMAFRSK